MTETKTFTWDYREQPPMDEIAAAVTQMSGGTVRMVMPETGSQEHGLTVERRACGHEFELGGIGYACERLPHPVCGYGSEYRHAARIDAGFAEGTDRGDGRGEADLVTWGHDSNGDPQDWAADWGTIADYPGSAAQERQRATFAERNLYREQRDQARAVVTDILAHLDLCGSEVDEEIKASWRDRAQAGAGQPEDGTPGYWQVRTALSSALNALQVVALSEHDGLAVMAKGVLTTADAVLEQEPGPPHVLAAAITATETVRGVVSELLRMFKPVSGGWAARTSISRLRRLAEAAGTIPPDHVTASIPAPRDDGTATS